MAENLINLVEGMIADLDTSYPELLKYMDPLNYTVAEGVWLDFIGGIVGENPRIWDPQTNLPETDDVEYRKLIGVKIALNLGSGGTEDIITAVRRFVLKGAGDWDSVKDAQFTMTQEEAIVTVEVINGIPDDAYRVKRFVSAGVALFISSVTTSPFAFSSLDYNYDPGTTDLGFSNLTTPSDGGDFKFFLTTKE